MSVSSQLRNKVSGAAAMSGPRCVSCCEDACSRDRKEDSSLCQKRTPKTGPGGFQDSPDGSSTKPSESFQISQNLDLRKPSETTGHPCFCSAYLNDGAVVLGAVYSPSVHCRSWLAVSRAQGVPCKEYWSNIHLTHLDTWVCCGKTM